MKACLIAIALALPGCASYGAAAKNVEEFPTRVAGALESVKAAYVAVCKPAPVAGAEKVCADAKVTLNAAIDAYNTVNNELPE